MRHLAACSIVFLALAGHAPAARAHAILVRSSLAEAPVRPDAPAAITLRFNAGVEVTLSRVALVNGVHEERPLEIGAGGKAGEIVVQVPALGAGGYGLKYRVMAVDGHLTDGMLRFTVAAPR
jgi:methionine-rich copper-binding protein CopC